VKRLLQGHVLPGPFAIVKAPYSLAVDLGSAVLRSPVTVMNAFATRSEAFSAAYTLSEITHYAGSACADSLVGIIQKVPSMGRYPTANLGFGCSEKGVGFRRNLVLVSAQLFDPLLVPLIDVVGTPSWQPMRRAAYATMVSPGALFDPALPYMLSRMTGGHPSAWSWLEPYGKSGPLSLLLDNLASIGLPVDVFAHSAGTIIASEMMLREDVPFESVVFMAAAATVREVESTVVARLSRDGRLKFHNLTLGPACEYAEVHGGVTPRGSLLVWLDDFITSPTSVQERTAGKWDNAIFLASQTPEHARTRAYLKIFGDHDSRPNYSYGTDRSMPCRHGDFNNAAVPFWTRAFRTP
jgi:hypothetical protein